MNIKEQLNKYINDNLKESNLIRYGLFNEKIYENCCQSNNIDNYIIENKTDNKFQKLLFKYIDRLNIKDSDLYNKVNIDRRLFSKIRNDINYHPKKETIILLALGLELNEDDTISLLNSASYSLPKNNTYDLIIRFCFINKIYNINQVNELLYEHNCPILN